VREDICCGVREYCGRLIACCGNGGDVVEGGREVLLFGRAAVKKEGMFWE